MRSLADPIHCLGGACPHEHPPACIACGLDADEDTLLCASHDHLADMDRNQLYRTVAAFQDENERLRGELYRAKRGAA